MYRQSLRYLQQHYFTTNPTTNFTSNYKPFYLICLNLLVPLSCLLCKQTSSHPYSLCCACQNLINRSSQFEEIDLASDDGLWQTAYYLGDYNSPLKDLIQMGKFQSNLASLKVLGQLFANAISIQGYDTDRVLIPVPLHHKKLLSRGFNQALEIALPIARILNLSINTRCISRIQSGKTQHFLSRYDRQHNTDNIFQINGPVPKKIAVIDDVFTTGATMRSICSSLKSAGAESIEVWIIARTLKHS